MQKVKFEEFQQIMMLIMNVDNVDRTLLVEYLNEWYELYKTTSQTKTGKWSVVEWAQQQFQDVVPVSHDFWLDWRGMVLFQLQDRVDNINVGTIFPVAGPRS